LTEKYAMFIGIEIGGTKLQVGLGANDGTLLGLWRDTVNVARGGEGIREQLTRAVPELLATAGLPKSAIDGVGIGFGGPVDDHTQAVIKSHQIHGWDGFPLGRWLGEALELPTVLGNDADVAGLAEATVGAGQGMNPVFYMTIGSGIGGGLLINGNIARGTGRGAAEIGHVKVRDPRTADGRLETLENVASGWGIVRYVKQIAHESRFG
jgi:glucokinase